MTKLNNKILPEYLKANDLYDSTISKTHVFYKEGRRYFKKLYEDDVGEALFMEYTRVVEIAGIRVLEENDSIFDETARNIDDLKFNLTSYLSKTAAYLNTDTENFSRYAKRTFLTQKAWNEYGWANKYKNSSFDVAVDVNIVRFGILKDKGA